jgi:7-cyano-7-deazaguanine synthase
MMPAGQTVRAVVLLSGGVDSATVMAIAHAEGRELYALSFDYGQRHQRELESAKMVAESFGVKKHLIVSFNLRDIGGSALTAEIDVPKAETRGSSNKQASAASHADMVSIPVTYVPARNTIFLSFALGWAEVIGAEQIYIGANAVDYSGYPDCRPEYLRSFEKMANLATRASVEGKMTFSIEAPLLYLSKAEIVKTGSGLGLDYSLTWSCYDPQPGAGERENLRTLYIPCGLCDSCRFREKGFREAGIRDPLTL